MAGLNVAPRPVLMLVSRFAGSAAPWAQVVTRRETSSYKVILLLECGHQEVRIKRTHRIYKRVQCSSCLKDIPRRPIVSRIPCPRVHVLIRPDIHKRFMVIVKRVEERMRQDALRGMRNNRDRVAEDDWGLPSHALVLPSPITVNEHS